MDGGEIKESCACDKRFLSSLTEKKEQGTSVSQGSPAVTSREERGLLSRTVAGNRAYNFAEQNIFIIAQNVV